MVLEGVSLATDDEVVLQRHGVFGIFVNSVVWQMLDAQQVYQDKGHWRLEFKSEKNYRKYFNANLETISPPVSFSFLVPLR